MESLLVHAGISVSSIAIILYFTRRELAEFKADIMPRILRIENKLMEND